MDQANRAALTQLRNDAPRYTGLEMEDADIAAFSLNNLIAGEFDKKRGAFERKMCQYEREKREEANIPVQPGGYTIPPAVFRGKRNIIVDTDADGGYLVDDNTVPVAFAEYLYTQSVVLPRATMLTDMKGTLSIGQETGKTTVVWGNEVSVATESQSTFGSIDLSPKELKVTTIVSKFLMQQSDPSAENLTRMCMMAAFAEAFDTKILYGTGGSEVSGLNQLDRIAGSTHPGKIEYDYDMPLYRETLTPACETIGKANAAEMLTWLLGWEFHSKACERYALLKDKMMLDIPVVPSSSVSAKDAWLGNWQYVVAAMWGGMDIRIDKTSLLPSQQLRIVGHYRVDSGALHDDAFVLVTPEA